ncbi:MAG: hypothetical protein ACRDTX_26935 [Pseudonocardiaceae bacterium]
MSATPIFEQLCREIHDAGRSGLADGTHPTIARQSKGPAHSLDEPSRGPRYERGSHVPGALAGWARPTG